MDCIIKVRITRALLKGEILGLQWNDIDFQKKIIHVRHNAVLGPHQAIVREDLKTKAASRNLPYQMRWTRGSPGGRKLRTQNM